MIKMKTLRSFGVPGANEGKVRRGREIAVANEQRAKDLENAGLAYRLPQNKMEPPPLNKIEPSAANKAADAGPLGLAGGETGEVAPAPSLHQARPQQKRRYPRSKDAGSQS